MLLITREVPALEKRSNMPYPLSSVHFREYFMWSWWFYLSNNRATFFRLRIQAVKTECVVELPTQHSWPIATQMYLITSVRITSLRVQSPLLYSLKDITKHTATDDTSFVLLSHYIRIPLSNLQHVSQAFDIGTEWYAAAKKSHSDLVLVKAIFRIVIFENCETPQPGQA